MTNLDLSIDGNILVIKVDLTQEHGLSGSGRSVIIATSHGNLPLYDPERGYLREVLNMTVCRPA